MTTLNNALRLLQAQIRGSQPALLTSFGAAPYHPGAPTLPAPVVPALLVHGGLNKNDLHDPTVPVAVQVVLQPGMFENDDLTLYLGTTAVAAETLRQEHLDSGIVTFYLAPSVFPQEGPVTLHYHHFVPMSSAYTVSHDVGPFLVKQTVPGDPDPDPLTPYLNERLTPITGIPDPVPPGQPLTVTVPRYAHISEGDTLVVYFSSEEVSTPVTAEQASNPNLPLTVTIPASVIDRTPGIGLIVRYDIHDTVKNWSLYSMEARVDVVPPGALHAPTVRDANDYDELDMDDLDGADVAIQIPVNGNLPLGTDGVLTWTGLPVIGPRLTHTQSFKIERAATRITLYVPNDKAAALVDSTATVYYEATLNGVNTPSQRASVQVIGEPVTLEKPTLTGVSGDSYNPASIIGSHQEVIVPAYGFMDRGQAVILHWEGRTASGSPFYARERKELTSDIQQDLSFMIDKIYATGLGTNTTLKVYYEITADGVTYASPKLELTIVGVPSNLPKPTTEPVFANGEIDPYTVTDAIKVVVEPNSTLAPGDLLTVKWLGRSGASIILNDQVFPNSGNLEIRIGKAPYIDGNTNAYVDVSYEARRNGQPVGSSQVLQLHVGEAAEQPWPLPTLIDASGGQVSTWQPVRPGTQFDTNTAKVVISDPRIRQHDIVALVWRLPDQTDLSIPWLDVQTAGEAQVAIPQDVLAKSLGKPVLVVGVVFRGGATIGSTAPTNFQIGTVPASSLSELIIMEAASGGAGPEFNVSGLTADANLRIGRWPLITQGQPVWLSLAGTRQDGSAWSKQVMAATPTDAAWASQGVKTVGVTLAELKALKDGSSLTVTFKVALEGSQSEVGAVSFAPRVYTVKSRVVVLSLPPSVREADLFTNTLNLLKSISSALVQIPHYEGLDNGDSVTMTWTGAAGVGTTQQTATVTNKQPPTFNVDIGVVRANIGRSVVIQYQVDVSGGTGAGSATSPPLNLVVRSSTPYGVGIFEPGYSSSMVWCRPYQTSIQVSNSRPDGLLISTDTVTNPRTVAGNANSPYSMHMENRAGAQPADDSYLYPTNVPGIGYKVRFSSSYVKSGIKHQEPLSGWIELPWSIEFFKVGAVTTGTVKASALCYWLFGGNYQHIIMINLASDIQFIVTPTAAEPMELAGVFPGTEVPSEPYQLPARNDLTPGSSAVSLTSRAAISNEEFNPDEN